MLMKQFPEGQVELTCLPASWHNTPEKIVPGLAAKIKKLKKQNVRSLSLMVIVELAAILTFFLKKKGIITHLMALIAMKCIWENQIR